MAETKNLTSKMSWDDEKKEFGKKALAQALYFMEKDNEMISHFAVITGALAAYLKDNPEQIVKLNKYSDSKAAGVDAVVEGGDFGSDLLALIRDILLGDKEFILNLIKEIFGL